MKMKRISKVYYVSPDTDTDSTYQMAALDYFLYNGWEIVRVDKIEGTPGMGRNLRWYYILTGEVGDDIKASSTWEDISKSIRAKSAVEKEVGNCVVECGKREHAAFMPDCFEKHNNDKNDRSRQRLAYLLDDGWVIDRCDIVLVGEGFSRPIYILSRPV